MGYKVLCDRDVKWQPRKGLEGPFYYSNGRVLYYDVKEGMYYDPTTDFYVEQAEMDEIHNYLAEALAK
jgi:hypothetical protein